MGGRLLQILSLRRGAYLKVGANSSIYRTCMMRMHEIIFVYLNCGLSSFQCMILAVNEENYLRSSKKGLSY